MSICIPIDPSAFLTPMSCWTGLPRGDLHLLPEEHGQTHEVYTPIFLTCIKLLFRKPFQNQVKPLSYLSPKILIFQVFKWLKQMSRFQLRFVEKNPRKNNNLSLKSRRPFKVKPQNDPKKHPKKQTKKQTNQRSNDKNDEATNDLQGTAHPSPRLVESSGDSAASDAPGNAPPQ